MQQTEATAMQQTSVKALAQRVLARNSACNSHATTTEKACNKPCNNSLVFVASDVAPESATRPFNQEDMDAIKSGGHVTVWSEMLGEWLLWVRGESERRTLKARGCNLPIYTLGELALVVSWPVEDIKRVHQFKKQFNGIIIPTKATVKENQ